MTPSAPAWPMTASASGPRPPPAWPGVGRPPGTSAATPENARKPTIMIWIRIAVRSVLEGGPLARATRSSVTTASPTRPPASTNAGASTSPMGTRRIAPSAATAAAAGRMSDSTGTPAPCAAGSASATTWSPPRNTAARSTTAIGHTNGSGANRDSAITTPTAIARSLAPDSPLTRASREVRHVPRLWRREPGEEVGAGAYVQHVPRLHPGPARLRDAPRQVRQLPRVVGVGVDREQAALGEAAPRPLDRQVQPVGRAVHLEARAGSRGGS